MRAQLKMSVMHLLRCDLGAVKPIQPSISGFKYGVFFVVKRTDKSGEMLDELCRLCDLMLYKNKNMNCGIELEAARFDKDEYADQTAFGPTSTPPAFTCVTSPLAARCSTPRRS